MCTRDSGESVLKEIALARKVDLSSVSSQLGIFRSARNNVWRLIRIERLEDVQPEQHAADRIVKYVESHAGFRSCLSSRRLYLQPGVQSGLCTAEFSRRRFLGLQCPLLGGRAIWQNGTQVDAKHGRTCIGCVLD